MPKKRSNQGRSIKAKAKAFKGSGGTIQKWNTLEDIPMDEEDQFHAAKDKILLDGDYDNQSDEGDEDEVFALKRLPDESESEEEREYYDDFGEELGQSEAQKKSTKREKKKSKKTTRKSKVPNEEEEESWGQGKMAYYSSNADQLASDDEEGNELEEQEAIRLQTKICQELHDEDFGLDDTLEVEKRPEVDNILDPPLVVIPALPTDKPSLLRHLEKTNPESLALARDWDDIAHQLQKTRLKIAKMQEEKSDALNLGMIHIHYQALLSYSTVLAFYLHLRASAKYAARPALLQSHPIMQRLLTLKQSLQTLEDLDFTASDDDDDDDDDDDEDFGDYMDMADVLVDGEKVWRFSDAGSLEPLELDDLLRDAEMPVTFPLESRIQKPPKKKRKVVVDDMDTKEATSIKSTTPVFDLVEPEFVSSKFSTRINTSEDPLDNYGDATSLTAVDAADKSARRKSLRFHTSKIENASSRRKGARSQIMSGDDDIPYRERKKDRDARLVQEAVKRAENMSGGDLYEDDDTDPKVGEKRSRMGEEDDESPDEYYELVRKRTKEKKAKKKTEYEEAHGLSRVPLEEESSGPRSLTRAILKNKGLTPQRPKAVRNPRVKKRQKFEKVKKKIASQKAVYKGGLAESKGRYEGEKSGISKVVKSVRLG